MTLDIRAIHNGSRLQEAANGTQMEKAMGGLATFMAPAAVEELGSLRPEMPGVMDSFTARLAAAPKAEQAQHVRNERSLTMHVKRDAAPAGTMAGGGAGAPANVSGSAPGNAQAVRRPAAAITATCWKARCMKKLGKISRSKSS